MSKARAPKVRRSTGADPRIVWALAGVVAALVLAIVLLLSGGLFDSEPRSELEADYAEALARVQQEPDDAGLLMDLAFNEILLGKTDDALAHGARASEIASQTPSITLAYSQILLQAGRLDDARGLLEPLLASEVKGDPDTRFILAQVEREAGNLDRAIVLVAESVELDPLSADRRVLYGEMLAEAGRAEDAEREFREAMTFLRAGDVMYDRAAEGLASLGVTVEVTETVDPHGDQ